MKESLKIVVLVEILLSLMKGAGIFDVSWWIIFIPTYVYVTAVLCVLCISGYILITSVIEELNKQKEENKEENPD